MNAVFDAIASEQEMIADGWDSQAFSHHFILMFIVSVFKYFGYIVMDMFVISYNPEISMKYF